MFQMLHNPENTIHHKQVPEVFRHNDPEGEIMAHNRTWVEYVRLKLNYRHQDASFVSRHHVKAGQYVKMFMLKRGLIVIANRRDGIWPMKIMCRSSGQIRALRVGDPTFKTEPIEFSDIVVDPLIVKEVLSKLPPSIHVTGHEREFYCLRDFPKAQSFADMAVHQCIKIGSFFEMQLAESPQFVVLAQVIKNHRGLLLVSFGKNPQLQEKRWIHMFDPLCHQFGWVRRQKSGKAGSHCQKVNYVPGYGTEILSEVIRNTVPSFVFRDNIIYRHRLQKDDIVVVADSNMNSFWIAHMVPSVANSDHFFYLKVGHTILKNTKTNTPYPFHVYHPRLFAYRMTKNIGVHIRVPDQLYMNTDESDLDAYRRVYCPNGRVLGAIIGGEMPFQKEILRPMTERTKDVVYASLPSLKFVEVLRPTPFGALQLCAAEVTGYEFNMIRLRVPGEENQIYMHYSDPHIFHVGACVDMGLAVQFDPKSFEAKYKTYKREKTAVTGFSTF